MFLEVIIDVAPTRCSFIVVGGTLIRDFFPIVSKLDTSKLYEPIKQALQGKDKQNSQQLLAEALSDLKSVWDVIQPKYKQAIAEVETWDKVAKQALKQNREDLARAAVGKKLSYRKQAEKLEMELKELAELTESILRNQRELG